MLRAASLFVVTIVISGAISGLGFFSGLANAGPYAPAAGQPGSTAIIKTDPSFAGWATGFQDYAPGSNASATFQTPNLALGPATGNSAEIVSLGDHGSITLTFAGVIFNGAGADLAVFENSFSDTFLELAYVEVSSDGTNFFRFPSVSFTPGPTGAFGATDPTNIDGLAGKYRASYGTPFDLDQLGGVAGLNINAVKYIRIVDIVGDDSALDNYPAAFGGPHAIYDPYPTVDSGGFDLDAVGALHLTTAVPEPSSVALLAVGFVLLAGYLRRRSRPRVIRLRRNARGSTVRRMTPLVWFATLLPIAGGVHAATVSTFDDLPLVPNSFYAPAATTTFASGAATFNHDFTDFGGGCCSSGWTYTNKTDTTTPGFGNAFSAYAGSGAGGSANYAVAFFGTPTVKFASPSIVASADFTNTTYAALSMLNGDTFAKKFGGASGNDQDFFKLTIIGKDALGATTGTVDYYLADYRFSNNAADYVRNAWGVVDLTSLGAVSSLGFELASSDSGQFGINTPAYFAMDNLAVIAVPEPGTPLLLLAGGTMLLLAGMRRKLHR
ncbi:MAG: DUF4465 domain-containing protein [Betaproteobacteria bacterium]